MIGLDTNILVRLLVEDDVEQAKRAVALLEKAQASEESLHLDPIVLVETAWVLRSVYRASPADIAEAVASLLGNPAYEIGDRALVEAALALYQENRAEFADCLIAVRNHAAGCRHTATFDAQAGSVRGMRLL